MDVVRSVHNDGHSSHSGGMGPILSTLGVTLSVTLLIVLLVAQRRRKQLPRGPFPWPVLGNFPALAGGPPHHVLRSLAKRYGGLMYLRLGSVPTIVVSTVEVSKELFQTLDSTFLDRPKLEAFSVLTEDYMNIAMASGRHWREMRKLVTTELLTPRRLATYKEARAEEIHNMMKVLVEEAKQGESVNLKSWLLGITCNNMTRMLTNKRYFGDGADSKKEKEDFESQMQRAFDVLGAFVISDYVPYLGFITKLQGWPKKFEQVRDANTDLAERMFEIEKHRQRAREREEKGDEEGYVPDMVDVLLRTPLDNGKILPDKNITLMLTDLLNAGSETSATSAEWGMAELMRRPDIMRQLQDELNTVIGPDRVPQESDLPNLPFLLAVVKETFRLHPAVALNIPRESSQPFEFRGSKFPRHTRLIMNFYAIHRDPSVYESPDEFKPERFLEHPEVNHLAGFEYYELTPFSAGRRMCPAATLANTMVSLMIAHLVHSLNWALPEGVETVDMTDHFGIAMSLKRPLRLVGKAKSPARLY